MRAGCEKQGCAAPDGSRERIERNADKAAGFDVDKIVQQLFDCINAYDIAGLVALPRNSFDPWRDRGDGTT